MKIMKKSFMYAKTVVNNRKKWYVKYIQILPAPSERATENIGKGFHY